MVENFEQKEELDGVVVLVEGAQGEKTVGQGVDLREVNALNEVDDEAV